MLGGSLAFGGRSWQLTVLGQPNFIIVTDPDCVKHVLLDNFDNYEKSFLRDRSHELLGNGIFNVDGDPW